MPLAPRVAVRTLCRLMIRPDLIETIRQRTDLVALIGESVRLARRGRSWVGCCPFHKEKTPSFHVSPDKGMAYCFGCKESVDAIGFVEKHDGLTFPEAVASLAGRLGLEVEETRSPQEVREAKAAKDARDSVYRANEVAAAWFEANLWSGEAPAGIPKEHRGEKRGAATIGVEGAWAELAKRGLAPTSGEHPTIGATLRAFRIGYAPPFWDHLTKHLVQAGISPLVAEKARLLAPRQTGGGHYDRFRNRLMFAVIDVQGRIVGFSGRALPVPMGGDASACKEPAKYVNTPESQVYTKGHHLFGLYQAKNAVRRADQAILVEGNFDVVSLHARGVDNVVAPLGTAFTQEQATLLKRFGAHVTIAFDGDTAGMKATSASREPCAVAALSARVATLPSGSDPDAIVRDEKLGVAAFQRIVGAANGLVEWLIDHALDPSTFRAVPMQEQLERVRSVGELLAKENDPEMRNLVQMYANRAASRLGLTANSDFTVAQLQSVIAGKQRAGAKPTPQVATVCRGPDWHVQEALLGALLDDLDCIDKHLTDDVGDVLEGDFALAASVLLSGTSASAIVTEMPESLRAFVAARMVAPEVDRDDVETIIAANVARLRAMRRRSSHGDLMKALDAAVASGNEAEQLRVMRELDALGRR